MYILEDNVGQILDLNFSQSAIIFLKMAVYQISVAAMDTIRVCY